MLIPRLSPGWVRSVNEWCCLKTTRPMGYVSRLHVRVSILWASSGFENIVWNCCFSLTDFSTLQKNQALPKEESKFLTSWKKSFMMKSLFRNYNPSSQPVCRSRGPTGSGLCSKAFNKTTSVCLRGKAPSRVLWGHWKKEVENLAGLYCRVSSTPKSMEDQIRASFKKFNLF